jgi:hypothetical protein
MRTSGGGDLNGPLPRTGALMVKLGSAWELLLEKQAVARAIAKTPKMFGYVAKKVPRPTKGIVQRMEEVQQRLAPLVKRGAAWLLLEKVAAKPARVFKLSRAGMLRAGLLKPARAVRGRPVR